MDSHNTDNASGSAGGRRTFVYLLLGGSVTAAVGGLAAGIGKFLWPPRELSGQGGSSQRSSIPLSEIPVGDSKKIRHQGKPYIVIRTEGGVFALSAVCTHLGCLVTWDKGKKELHCPCHSARFDVNGNVLGGPAPKPLATAAASVSGDQIVIGGS